MLPQKTEKEKGGAAHAELASDSAQKNSNQTANGSASASSNVVANPSVPKSIASGGGSPQTALPTGVLNALGGLKTLAGSAFALHVTPANGNQEGNGQGTNDQQQGNANSDGANQNSTTAGLELSPLAGSTSAGSFAVEAAHAESGLQNTQSLTTAFSAPGNWSASTPVTNAGEGSTAGSVVSTAPEVSEVQDEDLTSAPQTVRTVQIQLAGEGDGRVDLRLVQHGDGLSVSVRASDSALTKGLQDNLPELSARLAAEKYQTHTFLPEAGSTNASTSSSSEDHNGQSQDQSNGRSFSQSSDGRQSDSQSNSRQNSQGQQDDGAGWWRRMNALGKLSSSSSSSTSSSVSGEQSNTSVNP